MAEPLGFWRSFLARPNDDRVKTVGMAFLVAFGAALAVSLASVTLRPLQDAHVAEERAARMEAMLDELPGLRDLMVEAGVDGLETRVVDLQADSFAPDIDPGTVDPIAAAQNEDTSIALSADEDIAGLRRRSNLMPVYLLQSEGELKLIVLPVMGAGYQSMIRANLALEPDLDTIAALSVVEQGETPGLGARVAEPEFAARWPGKQITDESGEIAISVVRGPATGPTEVDGISGATRTSNAVGAMLQFWLGPNGYGPFLDRLAEEGL